MLFFKIRIRSLDADIARTSPDMLTLKRSVEAISRQIKAEGGPKLARAHAKVDSLIAQLQILNKTKSTKEVAEVNSKKQVNYINLTDFLLCCILYPTIAPLDGRCII